MQEYGNIGMIRGILASLELVAVAMRLDACTNKANSPFIKLKTV